MHFARHGVPDCLVSDNGPQYISSEFRRFAATWEFKHITMVVYYLLGKTGWATVAVNGTP